MRKIIICSLLMVAFLSGCSGQRWNHSYWEREQLSSNLHIKGAVAKELLDRDLAYCTSAVRNRHNVEKCTLDTKKCEQCSKTGGHDWAKDSEQDFVIKCMKEKGWIQSNCCVKKECKNKCN